MDFSLSPELADVRGRARRSIADDTIPFESDPRQTARGQSPELLAELIDRARASFYLAYNNFRIAVIQQGIAKRTEDGVAAVDFVAANGFSAGRSGSAVPFDGG